MLDRERRAMRIHIGSDLIPGLKILDDLISEI